MTLAVHTLRPRLQVIAYPFLSDLPDRRSYLTSEEQSAFAAPVELPNRLFDSVEFDDNLDQASFSMSFPGGAAREFTVDAGRVRLSEVVAKGNVIEIREDDRRLFAGYITDVQDSGDAGAATADLSIQGGGLDAALREQLLFIDFPGRDADQGVKQDASGVMKAPSSRFEAAIAAFSESIQEFNQADRVIQRVASEITNQFLNGGTYGGKKFDHLFDVTSGLSLETYTRGFLHVVNWINNAKFGQKISYWNLISDFARPPLYELFTAYNESEVFINSGRTHTPSDAELSTLIFRKAPWAFLDSSAADEALDYSLPANRIIRYDLRDSISDIFSGVHVGLDVLDQTTAILINPVTYAPVLLERFGQRVLPIQLAGIRFPERDETDDSPFSERLAEIQKEFFEVFSSGERSISGTIEIHYSGRPTSDRPAIAKGRILRIKNLPERQSVGLSKYDSTWYIHGVRTRFTKGGGEASQSLSVRWGRRRRVDEETPGAAADAA